MPKTASEKEEVYSTVKVPKGLIDEIDKMMDKFGFRSRSEFVKDAIRSLLRQYAFVPEKPRFVHFNVYEDHVTLMDNELNRLVDVWFRADKPWCEYHETTDCDHIRFVLELPKVIQALKEHGWKIEEGKLIRK